MPPIPNDPEDLTLQTAHIMLCTAQWDLDQQCRCEQ